MEYFFASEARTYVKIRHVDNVVLEAIVFVQQYRLK